MTTFSYLSDGYLLGMGAWLLMGMIALWVCLTLRRRWRNEPNKLRWTKAALSFWFFLAAATIPELFFALFYDRSDAFNFTNASRRWFQIHVQTNAAGFRDDRPFPISRPDGRRRIAFVGDSFTFGHGVRRVQARFSDRIAARLEQVRPGEFTVANCGIPGADLRQICDALLVEWIQTGTELDMLVYTFVLNDIETFDERSAQFYRRTGALMPDFFLFRDTYFYNWLYIRTRLLSRPEVRDYYSFLAKSYESEPFERLAIKVRQLQQLCAEYGIDLRIAVFPFLHNLGAEYPYHEVHRRLNRLFEENGIHAIDLEPDLSPFVEQGLVVNRFDPHPNERAHQIAAEAMEKRLLSDLFHPPAPEPTAP